MYDLCVQAAKATWNERLMSVPLKWRLKSCIGGPSAGEPVRPREMGVPSDGGEEAVAPRVPPVLAKPTQAEQDEEVEEEEMDCKKKLEQKKSLQRQLRNIEKFTSMDRQRE